jgi:hypothetical protein
VSLAVAAETCRASSIACERRSAGSGRAANSRTRRRVIPGASSASPTASVRIATSMSSGAVSLSRKGLVVGDRRLYRYGALPSVGAGLGAVNAVFNWGWGTSVLGLSGAGPVDCFVPAVMFSVLFGPSMDYLVFLVSRIQEDWHQLHHAPEADLAALNGHAVSRNQRAVTAGLANSDRLERGLPRLPVAERADSLAVVAGAESAPTRLALSLDRQSQFFHLKKLSADSLLGRTDSGRAREQGGRERGHGQGLGPAGRGLRPWTSTVLGLNTLGRVG